MPTSNPLRRSRKHRIIAGVCGGLAAWLGWDATLVRVLYVVVSIASAAFPGILVYIVLGSSCPRAIDVILSASGGVPARRIW